MNILVVDRDAVATQMLRSKLEPLGHKITEEPVKNDAVERLTKQSFDIIFIDPAPLTSARPIVLSMRRSMKAYPYIFLLSDTISQADALKASVNDLMPKPLNGADLDEKMDNAERLIKLMDRIGDDAFDFPSAGGVIAKSAINQLFLASIDRADRYGERSYLLQISLNNYQDLVKTDGQYSADFAVANLCKYLVLLRRQSDIIGQTAKNEYTLLLQRPIYETEPVEAASRFAESLGKLTDIAHAGGSAVEISVTLLEIPSAKQIVRHVFALTATNV